MTEEEINEGCIISNVVKNKDGTITAEGEIFLYTVEGVYSCLFKRRLMATGE